MSRRQRWRGHTKPPPQPVVRPDRFLWVPEREVVLGFPRRKPSSIATRHPSEALPGSEHVTEACP
jgi:hypothetical protein